MNDKEQRILFLKTKLETESKNLNHSDFFELLKDNMGWEKYNEIHSEYARNLLLDYQTHTKLTELGKTTLKHLLAEFEQETEDKKTERKKLYNETKLSNWQVKTFWPLFIFGLFGGLYSGYDFIKNLSKEETSVTKQELETEINSLRNLILESKKDTLNTKSKTKGVN